MDEALHLMTAHEYEVVSSRVLGLAAESGSSACDCEFVALAQDLNVSLVTVGKLILSQFPEVAIPLEKFIAA